MMCTRSRAHTLCNFSKLKLALFAVTCTACADVIGIPSDRRVGEDGAIYAAGECSGTINLRFITDHSGAFKSELTSYRQAEYDLIRKINEAGGVGGCPIQYEEVDTAYDTALGAEAFNTWRSDPSWPGVAAVFLFNSDDAVRLSPDAAADKKVVLSGSYNAYLASPQPVDITVSVQEVGPAPSFVEAELPTSIKTDGYPYNFFVGTDYSTAARIAMYFIKLSGGQRVGFAHCVVSAAAYCTGPLPAARTYAKDIGLPIGRALTLELDEEQSVYDSKVLQFFKEEQEHAVAYPDYQMVDWLWAGNSTTSVVQLAKALANAKAALASDGMPSIEGVHIIANIWGFDESSYEQCGAACAEVLHGVMAFRAYGDTTGGVPAMPEVMSLYDESRTLAGDSEAALAGLLRSDVRYVQGYVEMQMFKQAAELVVQAGKAVNGENLKAAFETFHLVDTGGLSDGISYTPTDHRPQAGVSIYHFDTEGQLVRESALGRIELKPEWLGW